MTVIRTGTAARLVRTDLGGDEFVSEHSNGCQCVLCGADAENLDRSPDVHHTVPVRAFRETPVTTIADAHTMDNVICLCRFCHRRVEHGALTDADLRRRINAT